MMNNTNIYFMVFIAGFALSPLLSMANEEEKEATDTKNTKEFGRLFNQPQTRAQLDANRKNPTVKKAPKTTAVFKKPVVIAKPKQPLPDPVSMQGYVKRTDGPNTVWINNKPVQENTTVDDVKVGRLTSRSSKPTAANNKNPEQLVIKIPANGKYVRLKAGQKYDAQNNEIKELTKRTLQESNVKLIKSTPANVSAASY